MARIAASSVSRTWHRASMLASSWCAFRSGAAREHRGAKRTRAARHSRMVSASRRHRGTHLGAVPRPRHEALSRRRTRPLRIVGWRRCVRQQPHENRGTTDGSLASQTKSCLTGHAGPLPGRSERPRLNVSRSESLQSNTEPSSKITRPGACRCRSLLALCAQSIEITWIAAIQSGRFATETSLAIVGAGTGSRPLVRAPPTGFSLMIHSNKFATP